MIKIINGDITKTEMDIIVQQVNCKGVMGAGLAKQILKVYPFVKKAYQDYREGFLMRGATEKDLLGHVNFCSAPGYDQTIANIFGQVDIRKNRYDKTVYTDEEALLKGIQKVKKLAEAYHLSVAIPTYIGCGLAGGDWSSIKPKIEEIFEDSDVDVAFYHYR